MNTLRKIPLGAFIEILQDLFENGADFIDISGESSDKGDTPKDTIKITVRPEYLEDHNEDDTLEQEIEMDYSDDIDHGKSSLSDEDINDLI